MKPSNLVLALQTLINAQQPCFIWGPPGVGKSEIVASVARISKFDLRDVRVNLLDPVDLRGFPYRDEADNSMCWAPPSFLPTKGKGILFLDELNSAAPAVQAACYQLILNRKIGEYTMPKGWTIIAAGNRETDRAVTHRMPSALSNRLTHLEIDVHLDDWCQWAIQNGIRTEILAFLRFRTNLLLDFNPNNKAFPSPRSWSFVDKILAQAPSDELLFELVKGTVGEGATGEFIAFLKTYKSIPNIDALLLNPAGTPIPEEPSVLYALSTALGSKIGHQNLKRAMDYVTRMPTEFQVVTLRDALLRDKTISSTSEFIQWVSSHGDVLIG